MKNFKSVAFASIAVTTAAFSPALMADTVELYYGPHAYYVGGEFTAVTTPSYNANYSPLALVNVTDANNVTQTGFETFCMQTGVDFTPYNWGNPTPYNFTYSLNSIGAPDAFALTEGTAYLYYQFSIGQLAGYDYTGPGRNYDAGELQAALWNLQGGQSYPGFPSATSGNPFYADALAALGANIGVDATLATDYGVEIMNMTDGNGNPAQNQLIYLGGGSDHGYTPVPDGGTTLGLLGLSLGGIAAVRRSLSKRSA
jgi:hypothetical protein